MPEEFLKIKKNSNFYIQGNLIKVDDVGDLNDYLIQLLGFYTTLENGITLSELVHSLYGMKKFIGDYFSEDYEVIRAFASATKLTEPYKEIRFYKKFRIESDDFMDDDEYVYITPEIEFVKAMEGESGFLKLGDIPIAVDDKLSFVGEDFSLDKKTKFTFLEILSCACEEVSEFVKTGESISY